MYLHLALVFLFARCASAISSPVSYSLTQRFHHAALRRSAGLAADLRKAMGGVLVARQPTTSTSVSSSTPQKRAVYCVSKPKPSASGSGTGNGTTIVSSWRPSSTPKASGSGSATATATSANNPSATPISTSSWNLVESHVSYSLYFRLT